MLQPDADRKLYSPNSAARALDVSRSKIYDLMKSGALGYIQIGSDRRIPIEEIERLAKHGTAKAA
ncbi:MAG: helix-turn-helix domain-containing protein [Betaproteobacteria bacterium]|nr:helix-turn-helix domain-containing protein [Betaproteobacteria bacterium]